MRNSGQPQWSSDEGATAIRDLLAGAAAGCLAAGVMLYAMDRWKRPASRVPPRHVAMGVAAAAGLKERMTARQRTAFTGVAHFAFGAAAGAPYGLIHRYVPLPPVAGGAAWGVAVWAASYAGWVPAAGILPPPRQRPARRNALLIGTHLLWGSLLGGLTASMAAQPRQRRRHHASPASPRGRERLHSPARTRPRSAAAGE